LDISGNLALVAARHEDLLGSRNEAYLFNVSTGQQVGRLNPGPDIGSGGEALEAIAVGGQFAVGGAESFDSPGFSNNGIAIVFDADLGLPMCDLDENGICDVDDMDALVDGVATGNGDPRFDLDGDGDVGRNDIDAWLADAAEENGLASPYLLGDSNLDGKVDSIDLNNLALNWQRDVALWSGGDFTADGVVDSADLNALALNWRQSVAAASPASAQVPEPSALLLMALGVAFVWRRLAAKSQSLAT
jgi:hypothetical protein